MNELNGSGYEKQLEYQVVKIGSYFWNLRALTRMEWGTILGSVQTIPSVKDETISADAALLGRREEIYRKVYESDAVEGMPQSDGIPSKPDYDHLIAKDPEDIGEAVLTLSGFTGKRVEIAGRSL